MWAGRSCSRCCVGATLSLGKLVQEKDGAEPPACRCSFGGEQAGRQRAAPHMKTYGRYAEVPGQGTQLAWLLLGSHNLSKAAWGALQKSGACLLPLTGSPELRPSRAKPDPQHRL